MEGEKDEGMRKKSGRVLAICPVVRAPSGQGEKTAPWLTKHTCTHMCTLTYTPNVACYGHIDTGYGAAADTQANKHTRTYKMHTN